jgi:flavin-dependent dehydrogenase
MAMLAAAGTVPGTPTKETAMRTTTHDVVVVGARPAGSTTALLLARHGLDVLVIDREAPGADALSTHALMRGGVVQLRRVGVLERLATGGTPAIQRVTFTYGGADEVVDLGGRPLYAPRRTVLDPLLVTAAREAGARVEHRVTATGLLRDATGRVSGVTARDAAGVVRHHRARIVVAADGLRSRIAQQVGAPMTWSGRASGAVAYAHVTGLPTDGYRWIYAPGAAAGLIPTDGGRTVVWTGSSSAAFEAGRHLGLGRWFARTLGQAAPELAEALRGRSDLRLRGFAGTPGFLRRPHGPGWALVGDAGCFADPISAHGITQALGDAELLSEAVAQVLRGGRDEHEALARYERQRDELALPVLRCVDAVATYTWTLPEVRGRLLELSAAMQAEAVALRERDHTAVPVGA